MCPEQFTSVSAIARLIQDALELVIGLPIWVQGEISSGRERGGAFYCKLIETDVTGEVIAELQCNIWSRNLSAIRRQFQGFDLDLKLDNGTKVGFQCTIKYHPRYGLSLSVIDADPTFALGELALRKQEIINRLAVEGLLECNKKISVPIVTTRIGLITSKGSAAYADFTTALRSCPYCFKIIVADAAVQGEKVEDTVIEALNLLKKVNLDLVVIIRGGGSKTELAALDNEAIAREIASYPLPVWTGIGHEIDLSVLDHAANRYFRTPTAVAEELIDRCSELDRHLSEVEDCLRSGARKIVDLGLANLREAANVLVPIVHQRLSKKKDLISVSSQTLSFNALKSTMQAHKEINDRVRSLNINSILQTGFARNCLTSLENRFKADRFRQRLQHEAERIDAKAIAIKGLDPAMSLKRGFSLVYSQDGKLVRSVNDVGQGEDIRTQVSDGHIISKVYQAHKNDQGG